MAYANVQNSGKQRTNTGAGLSWTPSSAPTLNNLLTGRFWGWQATVYTPGASDVKDSSGTPKTYTKDVSTTVAAGEGGAIYSLVVPSGLTTPLKNVNTTSSLIGVFDEWSGNATSSVLDQTNSNNAATVVQGSTVTYTGSAINTGANAGIVFAIFTCDDASTESAGDPSTTGTSFVQDIVEPDGSGFVLGSGDHRTTNAASQSGLKDTWSVLRSSGTSAALDVIASYNVPSGGGGPVIQMMTVADQSVMGSAI